MSLHTIAQAARQLQGLMVPIGEKRLRAHLVDRQLIYRDMNGDYLTTRRADGRYLRTIYRQIKKPLPGDPGHTEPHATVKITDEGIHQLHDELTARPTGHEAA